MFPRAKAPLRAPVRSSPRGRPAGASRLSAVRLFGFFFGGVLLANAVLMVSATFRGHAAGSQGPLGVPAGRHAAAVAEALPADGVVHGEASAHVPERSLRQAESIMPKAACFEQAREKLNAGLTHYYLQRGARHQPETLAVVAAMTTLLAGPAEPQAPDGCTG